MKWSMKDPEYGDMIRVGLGTIYHFGIYVSDEEVIQFGLAPSQRKLLHDSEVEVLVSDIRAFLAGGSLEVCVFSEEERQKNRSSEQIVSYARSKLGTRGYSIIYNNCEHFANECVRGERISRQAEDIRAMFRNMPIVDVYIAQMPEREINNCLSCLARQQEIDSISNIILKRQKYYVWKLLGYGLERSFGMKISDLEFKKNSDGRYSCDRIEFSLSHSENALAVAVSRKAVGIDIEKVSSVIHDNMYQRILNSDEAAIYTNLSDEKKHKYLISLWTVKEALFKESHSTRFEPLLQDTTKSSFKTYEKDIGGSSYLLSVATPDPEKIRIFEGIKL